MRLLKYSFCLFLMLSSCSCVTAKKAFQSRLQLGIDNVGISPASFNPGLGEKVKISYSLNQDAKVTIKIFDPDRDLVRNLVSNEQKKTGENQEFWDGKTDENIIVPDQAYFFTIEAQGQDRNTAVYDPVTISGGKEIDIVDAVYNKESGTISFYLPFPAWILSRLGIKNGALMKTLLDWEPRPEGENTISWNGKDESSTVDLYEHPKFSMMITTMSFPDNSIIAKGGNSLSYYEYKKQSRQKAVKKIERPEALEKKNYKLSSHYNLPRWKDRSPEFTISFPDTTQKTAEGIPIINDKALLKMVLDERDKDFITAQRFEFVLYVDDVLYAEEEEGYSPFTWQWNISGLTEGQHLLTVNVVSLNDQVGTKSMKFIVKKITK